MTTKATLREPSPVLSAPNAELTIRCLSHSDSILVNAIIPTIEVMNRLLRGTQQTTLHQIIVTTQATETTLGDGKGACRRPLDAPDEADAVGADSRLDHMILLVNRASSSHREEQKVQRCLVVVEEKVCGATRSPVAVKS